MKTLMEAIEMNVSYITGYLAGIKPKTMASSEWIALAKNDLKDTKKLLEKVKENNFTDDDHKINLLNNIQYSIYKTKNLLIMAKKRNDPNSGINPEIIASAEKHVASKWIASAEEAIASNREKNRAAMNSINVTLKESRNYYDTENYHLAILKAADVKVIANYSQEDNISDSIQLAKNSINESELTVSKINNFSIDVPLVELKIELAKLRLKDAEKQYEIGTSLIAQSSIQEALIVKEQINAIMDLKNAVENQDDAKESSLSMLKTFGMIPLLGIAITAYIMLRRRWQN